MTDSQPQFTENMPEVRRIDYRTLEDGNLMDRHAVVVPIPFSLEGLAETEVNILRHLSRGVSAMSPIAARQYDQRVIPFFRTLENLERATSDAGLRHDMHDYLDLIAAMNRLLDGKDTHLRFPGSPERIPDDHPAAQYKHLLFEPAIVRPGKAFYPEGITDADFEALGEARKIVNSVVVRNGRGYQVVLNENHFARELQPVISGLEDALDHASDDGGLADYMRANLAELRSGSPESRWNADLAWVMNKDVIDFRLRTADEVYDDRWKGIRGSASGSVMVTDVRYMDLCQKISALMPEIESTASWRFKKELNPKALPRLKFVNILNWSAHYDGLPFTVAAQSLPNDKQFVDKEGSVLMIYRNVQEALRKAGGFEHVIEEFMPREERKRYFEYVTLDVGMKMTIAHEQGHTTGGVLIKEEPSAHFGKDYAVMEEARAELISMFALPILAREGIIRQEEVVGGYYNMLMNIIGNLQFPPTDHAGARKMMFNYFRERGAVRQIEEDGKDKYVVIPEKMPTAVNLMLGTIGDIKARGDIESLNAFMAHYFTSNPEEQQRHFRSRLTGMPRGRLLLFPQIEGEGIESRLAYPSEYRAQPRTLTHSAMY